MSTRFSADEKFAAINALGEACLKMRKPGDWFVSQSRVDVKERGSSVIESRYGNGETPEQAIHDHFDKLTMLPSNCYVVIDSLGSKRRHVRWNGFMWAELPDSPASQSRATDATP